MFTTRTFAVHQPLIALIALLIWLLAMNWLDCIHHRYPVGFRQTVLEWYTAENTSRQTIFLSYLLSIPNKPNKKRHQSATELQASKNYSHPHAPMFSIPILYFHPHSPYFSIIFSLFSRSLLSPHGGRSGGYRQVLRPRGQ